MKTEKEIRKELASIQKDIDKVNDGTEDILQGWIEALEYVLHNPFERENLPPEFVKILKNVEDEVYYENGLKHISGGYAEADVIDVEEILDDDGMEVDVYVVQVRYGVTGGNNNSILELAFRKDNFKELDY